MENGGRCKEIYLQLRDRQKVNNEDLSDAVYTQQSFDMEA